MPESVLGILTPIISFDALHYLETNTNNPLFYTKTLRLRETKKLTQRHLVNKWQSGGDSQCWPCFCFFHFTQSPHTGSGQRPADTEYNDEF